MLEQARGILIADILSARNSEQARLRQVAPQFADELDTVRAQLDATRRPVSAGSEDPDGTQEADRRLAAGRPAAYAAWRQLIDRVRSIAGFEDFLRAPRIEQLATQAQDGPVVILATSPARCDALILTHNTRKPVQTVPLPAVTHRAIHECTIQLLRACQNATSHESGTGPREAAQQEILAVLGWLWDTITEPVLDALGHTSTPAEGGACTHTGT